MSQQRKHEDYLLLALQQAAKRRGFCAPNPAVGVVVVKQDEIISVGRHEACGLPHAEVKALTTLTDVDLHDATVYVTLEPCCHQGRTPACTELLIQRQVGHVVFAYQDPNPAVAGRGQKLLQAEGIICEHITLDAIDVFYRSYQHWQQTQTPWVTAKLALSRDEKIAGANGEPMAITGAALQSFTHQQRQYSDALLSTARTVIADDPQLNVRSKACYAKPLYLLDSQLSTPLNARIFKTCASITLFHSETADKSRQASLQQRGAECRVIAETELGLCLSSVIKSIGADGRHDVWIEAGGLSTQALLEQHLIQTLYLYQSDICLGEAALPAFHHGVCKDTLLQQAKSYQTHVIGDDLAFELQL